MLKNQEPRGTCGGLSRGAWGLSWLRVRLGDQVMISRFVSSGPMSGSVLTPRSLEPASDSESPSVSAPPLLVLCLPLCLSKNNMFKNKQTKRTPEKEFSLEGSLLPAKWIVLFWSPVLSGSWGASLLNCDFKHFHQPSS